MSSRGSATRTAGGKHSVFLDPAQARQLADDARADLVLPTVTTDGGVTTVTVPAVGDVTPEQRDAYARAAADGITAAAPRTCGWVVDLRGNTGGDMYPMLAGVSALLPDGTAFTMVDADGRATKVAIRPDGVDVLGQVTSVGERAKVAGAPVAVLQDGRTGSSGEAVLTSFRGLGTVASFGEPSAGYASANMVHRLDDGALLVLTVAHFVDRDGTELPEAPLAPDHEVAAAQAPDAARAWLGEQGCA